MGNLAANRIALHAGMALELAIFVGLGQACSGGDPGTGRDAALPGGSDGASTTDGAQAAGCDGIVGEGFAEGQIAANWTLLDGAGNPVSLYDHCGKVIYFEDGAEW